MTVTISDATPHNRTTTPLGHSVVEVLAPLSSLDFAIGPEVTPDEAMERATAVTSTALPLFLKGHQRADQISQDVRALMTELVDVTARHKAGLDLVGRISYDGTHVTVTVGDMDGPLPPPEEEPGLYLVHRVASDIGQYAGDHGGQVTWAAVPA